MKYMTIVAFVGVLALGSAALSQCNPDPTDDPPPTTTTTAAPTTTTTTMLGTGVYSLVVPQGTAFSFLGHSCGGIQEQAYVTGFDATSGAPTGDVYLSTRCGGSGRGGGYHTTTYSAWVAATWDFNATIVSTTQLAAAPTVDPTFSATNAQGDQIYNQSTRAVPQRSLTAGAASAACQRTGRMGSSRVR